MNNQPSLAGILKKVLLEDRELDRKSWSRTLGVRNISNFASGRSVPPARVLRQIWGLVKDKYPIDTPIGREFDIIMHMPIGETGVRDRRLLRKHRTLHDYCLSLSIKFFLDSLGLLTFEEKIRAVQAACDGVRKELVGKEIS